MVRVIRAGPVDNVHIETTFSAVCPIDHSIDNYVIEIDYKPSCNTDGCNYLELSSLGNGLMSLKVGLFTMRMQLTR
ncbi:hypothetical protein [Vulcanisaeta souniana]|uniref:hypothetical protein n=1 Tax=Vulcanisaeta souniana TaxID=164452 RepID=UPI0006D20C24|nr:hypothetical protein [Vulcanisaeta souniana]